MFRGWVRNHSLTDPMILNQNILSTARWGQCLDAFQINYTALFWEARALNSRFWRAKTKRKKTREKDWVFFPGWGARVMKCWWLKPMMKLGHVTQIRDEGFIIASPWDLRCWVPTVRAGLMMTNVSLCRLQKGGEKVEGGKKPPQESENKPKRKWATAK